MLDQEIINRNRNINRGYRKLEVWQEGIELYVLVRKKLKSIDSVPFKVKAQIEDSILSCPSNIAEGYSRRSIKEKNRYHIFHTKQYSLLLNHLTLNLLCVFAV